MGKIRIILADDHEIFRNGLKQLINKEPDMEVVAEASNGAEAIELVDKFNPDLLILDIRMPGITGIEAAECLLQNETDVKVVIFSLYDNEDYVIQALTIGASGFLLKDTSNKIFLHALRTVHNGGHYYIGEVSDVVIRHLKSTTIPNPVSVDNTIIATPMSVQLSKRENEIIDLVASGKNSKQAADELGVSVRTVDAHRLNILRKYAVNSMDEVLALREQQV